MYISVLTPDIKDINSLLRSRTATVKALYQHTYIYEYESKPVF